MPTRFCNAALIYNPLAGRLRGRRQRELDRAVELLTGYGIRTTVLATTGPGSATEIARQELAVGRDLIIVCGGDGTINEVVNGMAGSPTPLAILPAGHGNALATALGLPWSIQRAAHCIPRSEVRRIALGRAGTRYFVNWAGAGVGSEAVYRFNQLPSPRFKVLRGAWELFRHLALYDFPWFDVHIAGQVLPATQVFFCRCKYFAFPITPNANLFSDDFEVCIVASNSRMHYLLSPLLVFSGTLKRSRAVHFFRARSAEAQPRTRRIRVDVDAEAAGELPMEFVVVPDALSLLVPPGHSP